MEMTPVDSTNISSIGYDYKMGTLRIEFLKGGTYDYFGVPPELYEGIMSAGSKGQYLDLYVKKAGYTYAPV